LTNDNRREPTASERAIFDRMNGLAVSMPLNGHELGTVLFMTESFPQVGAALLADMPPDHVDRRNVEAMMRSAAQVKDRIEIALHNLQIAATAMLSQEADQQATAPSTTSSQ
jgi:hypothetical protein